MREMSIREGAAWVVIGGLGAAASTYLASNIENGHPPADSGITSTANVSVEKEVKQALSLRSDITNKLGKICAADFAAAKTTRDADVCTVTSERNGGRTLLQAGPTAVQYKAYTYHLTSVKNKITGTSLVVEVSDVTDRSELDSILFMPYAGAPPQENIVLLGSDANILPTQLPAGEAALLREGITAGRQYLNDLVPR